MNKEKDTISKKSCIIYVNMKNEKFRKALDEYAKEMDLEIKVLDNCAYDNSIVGITEDGRLVYDYNLMVEEYAQEYKCDVLDAMEWIDYNTIPSLPYFGHDAPIVIVETPTSLMEKY